MIQLYIFQDNMHQRSEELCPRLVKGVTDISSQADHQQQPTI